MSKHFSLAPKKVIDQEANKNDKCKGSCRTVRIDEASFLKKFVQSSLGLKANIKRDILASKTSIDQLITSRIDIFINEINDSFHKCQLSCSPEKQLHFDNNELSTYIVDYISLAKQMNSDMSSYIKELPLLAVSKATIPRQIKLKETKSPSKLASNGDQVNALCSNMKATIMKSAANLEALQDKIQTISINANESSHYTRLYKPDNESMDCLFVEEAKQKNEAEITTYCDQYTSMSHEISLMKDVLLNKEEEIKQLKHSIRISSEVILDVKDINKYKQLYEKEKEEKEKVIQNSKSLAQSLKDLLQHKSQMEKQESEQISYCMKPISQDEKLFQKERELSKAKLKLCNIEKQCEALSLSLSERNALIEALTKNNSEYSQKLLSHQQEHKSNLQEDDQLSSIHQIKELEAKNNDLQKLLLKIKAGNDSLKTELKADKAAFLKEKDVLKKEKDALHKQVLDLNQQLSQADKELQDVSQSLKDGERDLSEKEKKIAELLSASLNSARDETGQMDLALIRREIEDKDKEVNRLKRLIESKQVEFRKERTSINDKMNQLQSIVKGLNEENDELKEHLKKVEEVKQKGLDEISLLRKIISSQERQLDSHRVMIGSTALSLTERQLNSNESRNKLARAFGELSIVASELMQLTASISPSQSEELASSYLITKEKDDLVLTLTESNDKLTREISELNHSVALFREQLKDKDKQLASRIEENKRLTEPKPISQSQSHINQLEQNYSSAKELINSLKKNNEETNKLLKESLIENKQLKESQTALSTSSTPQYTLPSIIAQFKALVIDLIQSNSPHLLSLSFTDSKSPENSSNEEEKYYDLLRKFKEELSKAEEKHKKYKEMMKKMGKTIQSSQKEQQALLSMQSDLVNKISNRESELEEIKKQMKQAIDTPSVTGKENNSVIPFEKYQQVLKIFSIAEENYKQDIEALILENSRMKKTLMNQSFLQFSSDNNKSESPNTKEISCDDSHSLSRVFYNVDFIEKKLDDDEQLFKDQLDVLKEELKATQKELQKYKSIATPNEHN